MGKTTLAVFFGLGHASVAGRRRVCATRRAVSRSVTGVGVGRRAAV